MSLHAALAESELVKDMLCLFGLGTLVPSPVSRGADGVGQDEAVDRVVDIADTGSSTGAAPGRRRSDRDGIFRGSPVR